MIYTVGGIKGGSGKTTIATNLAVLLANQKKEVLLIDADDQESATDFTAFRNHTLGDLDYTAVKLTGKEISKQVIKLAPKFDDIVIDVGGRDTNNQRAALVVSHVALIPFVGRAVDIWTLKQLNELLSEVSTFNPDLLALTFINKADHQGRNKQDATEILETSEYLKFIDTPIGNRIVFGHAIALGLGVIEYKPADEKATAEIYALYNAVNQIVKEIQNA
jgi:chromosome partitioning protein